MALIRYLALIFLACFVGWFVLLTAIDRVSANHAIYLPLVPDTPLMQQIIRTQSYTYCLDSRAAAYPAFASQIRDVADQYEARVGIKAVQVADDATCQVRHTMPLEFSCGSAAAACIYYANWPVTVEYKATLGFIDWRSTQGHEVGHGVLGLHEQYRDSGGTIACTGRTDTVMDCGSGVRYPQPLDIGRGCTIIATSWCGQEPPPPPPACVPAPGAPCWTGEGWAFADGWYLIPNDPGCGNWWDNRGNHAYGACDPAWNGRLIPFKNMWIGRGASFWDGQWYTVP